MQGKPRTLIPLLAGGSLVVATMLRALFGTPVEARQGVAQKILYVHAPSAWAGFMSYGIVAVTGALYLGLKDLRLDRIAESAAEVGTVFLSIVLVSGPLWARPVWGTYWTWDARLTFTLFLWFIFVAYLLLRGAIEDRHMRARFSAVLGIMGALLVPFIHLSVYLFRTLHPRPVFMRPEGPAMPREMSLTLSLGFLAFTVLALALIGYRFEYAQLRDHLQDDSAANSR